MHVPKPDGFKPFMDKEKLFENAVQEVTNHLDQVMEHYDFLQDGDYETGRAEQFHKRNLQALLNIQELITRWSWIRTKFSEWNSDEMVFCWKRHRQEYEVYKDLKAEYIRISHT